MSHTNLFSDAVQGQLGPQGLDETVLAYEYDDEWVTVLPVPSGQGVANLEVSAFVAQLPSLEDPALPDTLRVLLRINGEGLLHHGWMIASDEDRVLILRRLLPVEGLDTVQLEHWVGQALERAASLRALLESRAEGSGPSRSSGDPADWYALMGASAIMA
jgi:hypothetical protein